MAKKPVTKPCPAPIVIEFAPGIALKRVPPARGPFRGVPRAPARTDVLSADGRARAEIPADQIVFDDAEAKSGCVRIGLGGMSYEGLVTQVSTSSGEVPAPSGEMLVFWRVRDVVPNGWLGATSSPTDDKLLISTSLVRSLRIDGAQVWPALRPTVSPTVGPTVSKDT